MKRKRTKKVILAVVMLVIVVSIFSLNVFADTFIDLPVNTTTQTYKSDLGTIKFAVGSNSTYTRENIYSFPLTTTLSTNIFNQERTQSFNGSFDMYQLRETTNTTPYRMLYTGSYTLDQNTSGGIRTTSEYIKYGGLSQEFLSDDSGGGLVFTSSFEWNMKDFYIDAKNRNYVPLFTFADYSHNSGFKLDYTIVYQRELYNYETGEKSIALGNWNKEYTTMTSPVKIVPDEFSPRNVTITNRNGDASALQLKGIKIVSATVRIILGEPDELFLFDRLNFTEYITVTKYDAQGNDISPVMNSQQYDKLVSKRGNLYTEVVDIEANDFWDFIRTSIGGFFNFAIVTNIPTIPPIDIPSTIALMIIVLKVFAGG